MSKSTVGRKQGEFKGQLINVELRALQVVHLQIEKVG